MLTPGIHAKKTNPVRVLLGSCIAIASGFLVFHLIQIDDSARHIRLWDEIRVLANSTQRRSLVEAHALHVRALAEADAISEINVRKAISAGDLGYLDYRAKQYDRALKRFKQAADLHKALLANKDTQCDPGLLKADLAKITLLTARCYDKKGDKESAWNAYCTAADLCAERNTKDPIDLLVCDRFVEAFTGACNLSTTFENMQVLASKLTRQVIEPMSHGYRTDILTAFTQALHHTAATAQQKLQLWNTVGNLFKQQAALPNRSASVENGQRN